MKLLAVLFLGIIIGAIGALVLLALMIAGALDGKPRLK